MNLDVPVLGILRGVDAALFGDVMQTSFSTGLQAIELTMNTRNAEQIVSKCRSSVPSGKLLGMGTIRNLDDAERAVGAGAMFLVSPNFDPDVIEFAGSKSVPIIAGALTPTEIFSAWSAGAAMVKVFPCRALGGPRYIRDLKGPYDQIKLVAVGGVSESNIGEYFAAGTTAVGVGASLFGSRALKERDMQSLAENVNFFIKSCLQVKDAL